ncbi:MAG: type IV toxin-antitoxin system AbiEi family antitoxin domain-containing protein [Nocardioidaceae bacterium]|nr:type IV toxin-antitoxin system AbiEi family antitoxin domain-containing protein [Nocardioidaceae bacterium]
MDDALRTRAMAQHNVFSTTDARELGHDDRSITRAVRRREWVRIRRGFYVLAEVWAGATSLERHLYTARAVVRSSRQPVALSHVTGTVALKIATYEADLSTIHVTRLDGRHGVREHRVMHHEGPLSPHDCLLIDDELLVAPPARTVFGAMTLGTLDQAVVIGDSALNKQWVDEDALSREAAAWVRVANTRTARFAVVLLDGGAESPGESLGRQLFWRQGLPRPQTQFLVIGAGGEVAYLDWYWKDACVGGEFDGKQKYLRSADDATDAGEVVFREKRREDWLLETGQVRFLRRMTWADIFVPGKTASRFRSVIERGRRGDSQR